MRAQESCNEYSLPLNKEGIRGAALPPADKNLLLNF